MSNPETHECPTCGYVWLHGKNGSHNCNVLLLARIEDLETSLTESTQKLEKACSVLERANTISDSQAALIKRLTTSQ